MFMPVKKILSLPVVTASNVKLGMVLDVIFDIENHSARQYIVGRRLVGKKLVIGSSQVILISNEKMVVDDAVLRESNPLLKNISISQTAV
ncbi:MAG: PRC-barrel domain-containing protein [Candidatus Magasanikbacteria bacterium]|jgi:sporulation protein YlmC with PRC-barrel domain